MIRKVIRRCSLYMSYAGMVLLLPMMLLTSSEVVGRAVWSRPIPGSMELSSYMLAAFILLGLAYTQQVKGHVRVTMLVSRLPEGWALILDAITTLLSLFIIALMAWQGWVVGIGEETVSDMLRIPQFPFRLLVFIGGGFLFLELLFELTDTLKKLGRR
jgi:TRAP-type C4-dicarboxylate transport system permease small subunit